MSNILVADDEYRIRNIIKSLLKDHHVTTASNWYEVKEMISNNTYHLVITDIVMPGYKKIAVDGVLKVFDNYEFPVIFISGYSEQKLGDLPPHVRFVAKPFSMSVMKMHINKLLSPE